VFSEVTVPAGILKEQPDENSLAKGKTGPPLNPELAIAAQHGAEHIGWRKHAELTDHVEDLFAIGQT
jgi:hypothetical protein